MQWLTYYYYYLVLLLSWTSCCSIQQTTIIVDAIRLPWPLHHIVRKVRGHDDDDYTPLLFFTVPPGLSPEVDAMEKAVRTIERQLKVHVKRMDLLRHEENDAVLKSIARGMTAPYLYNRESLQVYYITPTTAKNDGSDEEGIDGGSTTKRHPPPPVHVDMDRIRAWAKGRYLPPKVEAKVGGIKVFAPKVVTPQSDNNNNSGESNMEVGGDNDELLEELTMTPLQRKGKQAMKERTEQLAMRNANSNQ